MTGWPMPVGATSDPKTALTSVDLPTPVLPKIARLKRPTSADCLSYSWRKLSRNQSVPAMPPAYGEPRRYFFSRQRRSNGSRHACGATSWWMALGPQVPGAYGLTGGG